MHVIELGFEPKTHSLEGCCSIQLSYSTCGCKYSYFSRLSRKDFSETEFVPLVEVQQFHVVYEFILRLGEVGH